MPQLLQELLDQNFPPCKSQAVLIVPILRCLLRLGVARTRMADLTIRVVSKQIYAPTGPEAKVTDKLVKIIEVGGIFVGQKI